MPACLVQQVGQRRAEEVEVLEHEQRPDVHYHAQAYQTFSERAAARPADSQRIQEIKCRNQEEQGKEPGVPKRVEIVTGGEQEPDARQTPRREQPVEEEDRGEKYEVVAVGEKHRVWLVDALSRTGAGKISAPPNDLDCLRRMKIDLAVKQR